MNYTLLLEANTDHPSNDPINEADINCPAVQGLEQGHQNPRYSLYAARRAVSYWNGVNHELYCKLTEDVT